MDSKSIIWPELVGSRVFLRYTHQGEIRRPDQHLFYSIPIANTAAEGRSPTRAPMNQSLTSLH